MQQTIQSLHIFGFSKCEITTKCREKDSCRPKITKTKIQKTRSSRSIVLILHGSYFELDQFRTPASPTKHGRYAMSTVAKPPSYVSLSGTVLWCIIKIFIWCGEPSVTMVIQTCPSITCVGTGGKCKPVAIVLVCNLECNEVYCGRVINFHFPNKAVPQLRGRVVKVTWPDCGVSNNCDFCLNSES